MLPASAETVGLQQFYISFSDSDVRCQPSFRPVSQLPQPWFLEGHGAHGATVAWPPHPIPSLYFHSVALQMKCKYSDIMVMDALILAPF